MLDPVQPLEYETGLLVMHLKIILNKIMHQKKKKEETSSLLDAIIIYTLSWKLCTKKL